MKPGVVITLSMFDDGSPPDLNGMRIAAGGAREQLLIPECLALMARTVDLAMCAQADAMKKASGPKIQLARGGVPPIKP